MTAPIDVYSLAAKPLNMLFGTTVLGVGTCFLWIAADQTYLITNWHIVSGIDPISGKHLDEKTLAEPDRLEVGLDAAGKLGSRAMFPVSLFDSGKPRWFEHPRFARAVDVVALPIELPPKTEAFPINKMVQLNLEFCIGAEAFILGYPFGIGPSKLPVWKRASIASEPSVHVNGLPQFFVDTASRSGMSGAPVIIRARGAYQDDEGYTHAKSGAHTRIAGIYSGRLGAENMSDAQLGIVWHVSVIDDILTAKKPGHIR